MEEINLIDLLQMKKRKSHWAASSFQFQTLSWSASDF